MTFAESKQLFQPYYAYQSWVSIQEARDLKLIPEEYSGIFDTMCECGSENMIATNLRREMCCNPRCPEKEAYKLSEMFTRYGILGLGYANCKKVYGALRGYDKALKEDGKEGLFKYNTYTEVLNVPWESYPISIKGDAATWTFFSACLQIKNQPVTFPKMVEKLGLAMIGSNAEVLLDGINSFQELADGIKASGGVMRYCMSHGVHSPEVMFNFGYGLEDIAVAEFSCRSALRQAGLYKLSVCITGSVSCRGVSMTKEKFVEKCNKLCRDRSGVQLLELKNTSGPVTVPFVLYTKQSGSAKYNTGKSRGVIKDEFGEHTVLMTVTEFYDWLERGMKAWNENLEKAGTISETFTQVLEREMQKMRSQTMAVVQAF